MYVWLPRGNLSVMGGSVEALSTKTGNDPTEKNLAYQDQVEGLSTKTDDDQG